jgi:hypothetical protein
LKRREKNFKKKRKKGLEKFAIAAGSGYNESARRGQALTPFAALAFDSPKFRSEGNRL